LTLYYLLSLNGQLQLINLDDVDKKRLKHNILKSCIISDVETGLFQDPLKDFYGEEMYEEKEEYPIDLKNIKRLQEQRNLEDFGGSEENIFNKVYEQLWPIGSAAFLREDSVFAGANNPSKTELDINSLAARFGLN